VKTLREQSETTRLSPGRGLKIRSAIIVALAVTAAACGGAVQDDITPAASSMVVELRPPEATVAVLGQQAFLASVTGTAETRVTWTIVEGSAGGAVVDGSYTAPSSTGTYHVVVASLADPTKTATASITVTATPGSGVPAPSGSAKMGTNLNWCVDWDPEKLPADLMWSARPWAIGDGNGGNTANWAPIDARGWPIVAVGTGFGAVFEGSPWPGVYKLSFKNRQGSSGDTVSSYSGNITLTNRRHDSATNVTSYDVNVPSYSSTQFIWLRWAGSTGGVTDVHLMRPLKDGSGWHAIGTPLSDHIIDRLANFSAIRTMQTGGGSAGKAAGTDSTWAGRTKPWSSQQRSGDAGRFGGVAIENLIAMANQAGKDLWINLPFNATNDYIEKVAQTIRYGSDGVTPYTSPQASPVFPPLSSSLAVYVEHGNEIWNGGPGYWANENYAQNNSEIAAGDPNRTTYNGTGNAWEQSWRRVGWLAVRHSLIFRGVFGDAAMMTRVRPVLATQHGRYATTAEPLNYIRDVWGAGSSYATINGVTNPRQPVSHYLYALATAPYTPDDNGSLDVTTADTILSSVIGRMNSTAAGSVIVAMTWNANTAKTHGIRFVAYEGGDNLIPELMSGGATAANIQKAKDASFDSILGARMGANIDPTTGLPLADQSNYVYGKLLAGWAAAGGGLFMHFTLGESANAGSMFGLCPPSAQGSSDCRLETGPKWAAVKAFRKSWGP
jgi:hypothetical protein